MTLRIAIVGFGKIARDQHVPAIDGVEGVELVAVADPAGGISGVAQFASLDALLASGMAIDAISLCTPPVGRGGLAAKALGAGLHVLMEKPPGATLGEVSGLERLAKHSGRTLFATWHSRFAPAIEATKALLATTSIRSMRVVWKEDVRKWHPGQQWIWQPGGMGVFDPGINALSIVTHILPRAMHVVSSDLYVPANRETPIAARLSFEDAGGVGIEVEFDWRQEGPQSWDIHVETDAGQVLLSHGGRRLDVDGEVRSEGKDAEYDTIYRRFGALVDAGESDVDLSPLVHVADAFMLGRRHGVEAFEDTQR